MKFAQYINVAVRRFLALKDTPSAYTGAAGKLVAVNDDENALEFITAPSGGASPPTTVTSTTENTDSGTNHTHELNTTGVTAGSYTLASLTVDNKGRLTAASSGAADAMRKNNNFLSASTRSDVISGMSTAWVNLSCKLLITVTDTSTGAHDENIIMISRNSVEGISAGVETLFGTRSLNWKISFVTVSGEDRLSIIPATGASFGFNGAAAIAFFNYQTFTM